MQVATACFSWAWHGSLLCIRRCLKTVWRTQAKRPAEVAACQQQTVATQLGAAAVWLPLQGFCLARHSILVVVNKLAMGGVYREDPDSEAGALGALAMVPRSGRASLEIEPCSDRILHTPVGKPTATASTWCHRLGEGVKTYTYRIGIYPLFFPYQNPSLCTCTIDIVHTRCICIYVHTYVRMYICRQPCESQGPEDAAQLRDKARNLAALGLEPPRAHHLRPGGGVL